MNLLELFNKPQPWRWSFLGPRRVAARFEAGGVEYSFKAHEDETGYIPGQKNAWETFFQAHGNEVKSGLDILNTGNAVAVFSTIVDIMKDFVNKYDPDAFYFTASLHEPSRIKLYDRLAKMIQQAGYTLDRVEDEVDIVYTFYKK